MFSHRWLNAGNDSYDTMQYLAQQPWSTGTMFSVGASADGAALAEAHLFHFPTIRHSHSILSPSLFRSLSV